MHWRLLFGTQAVIFTMAFRMRLNSLQQVQNMEEEREKQQQQQQEQLQLQQTTTRK